MCIVAMELKFLDLAPSSSVAKIYQYSNIATLLQMLLSSDQDTN